MADQLSPTSPSASCGVKGGTLTSILMGDRKNSGSSNKVTITQHLCIMSECVLTRIQYNVENIMQLSYFLRLPLAAIMVQREENNIIVPF